MNKKNDLNTSGFSEYDTVVCLIDEKILYKGSVYNLINDYIDHTDENIKKSNLSVKENIGSKIKFKQKGYLKIFNGFTGTFVDVISINIITEKSKFIRFNLGNDNSRKNSGKVITCTEDYMFNVKIYYKNGEIKEGKLKASEIKKIISDSNSEIAGITTNVSHNTINSYKNNNIGYFTAWVLGFLTLQSYRKNNDFIVEIPYNPTSKLSIDSINTTLENILFVFRSCFNFGDNFTFDECKENANSKLPEIEDDEIKDKKSNKKIIYKCNKYIFKNNSRLCYIIEKCIGCSDNRFISNDIQNADDIVKQGYIEGVITAKGRDDGKTFDKIYFNLGNEYSKFVNEFSILVQSLGKVLFSTCSHNSGYKYKVSIDGNKMFQKGISDKNIASKINRPDSKIVLFEEVKFKEAFELKNEDIINISYNIETRDGENYDVSGINVPSM